MPSVLVLAHPALPLVDLARELAPDGWALTIRARDEDPADLAEAATDADFVLAFGGAVPDEVLRAGSRLRLVQLCSAGFDGVDMRLARELGVPVANNGGANAIPVAEFTIALVLNAMRHAVIADRDTRAGRWMSPALDGRDTRELTGKTVGIVGAGRIGSQVAALLAERASGGRDDSPTGRARQTLGHPG